MKGKQEMTYGENQVYFYAFRYCLGRMTVVVNTFCEEATAKIGEIGYSVLEAMDGEITTAERFDELGGECDKADWLKFREVIRAEMAKRKAAK